MTNVTEKLYGLLGKKGMRIRHCFQENIHVEYGYSKVCTISLTENKRNTFRELSRLYTRQIDTFLFDIPRCKKMHIGKY